MICTGVSNNFIFVWLKNSQPFWRYSRKRDGMAENNIQIGHNGEVQFSFSDMYPLFLGY